MRFSDLRLQWCVVTVLGLALTGCMVGPDFHSPASPKTEAYTAPPLPIKTVSTRTTGAAGKSQYFVLAHDIPAEWWSLFHSSALDNLIRTGLTNSPNLSAAEAALREAKETYNAQVGASLYPAVNAQLGAERERLSEAGFGAGNTSTEFSLYNASVNVSYTLDVFGGARRELEALRSQVDYQRFEVEAAYLTLTSNIVTTAITAASLAAQIHATHELIHSEEKQLGIVKKQLHLGGVSNADVLSQETQLATTRASLPPLEQSLSQSQHALSVLVGAVPSEGPTLEFDLSQLELPTHLPVSLPSSLVRNRPDIRASEELLHAASAGIGVATANLYPQITLNGSYGWESTAPSALFKSSTAMWSVGGGLLQPIFNAGSLQAKRRAAIAGYEQAQAQYHQIVLQAFQNVADTLRALQHDAETFRAQNEAEIAARGSLRLTQKQFHLGGVSYLSLLVAERQYQQARISRIQAQAARYNDTAALFQALGGGWWNRKT